MPIDLQQGPGQDQNTDSLASATLLEAMNFAFVSEKNMLLPFLLQACNWLLAASFIGF